VRVSRQEEPVDVPGSARMLTCGGSGSATRWRTPLSRPVTPMAAGPTGWPGGWSHAAAGGRSEWWTRASAATGSCTPCAAVCLGGWSTAGYRPFGSRQPFSSSTASSLYL